MHFNYNDVKLVCLVKLLLRNMSPMESIKMSYSHIYDNYFLAIKFLSGCEVYLVF